MITEKQMKIVDAVNELMGGDAYLGSVGNCKSGFLISNAGGDIYCLSKPSKLDHLTLICTIKEYDNCIEEMKYHYDIPKWCSYNRADKEPLTVENSDYSFYEKEAFVYGQVVYWSDGSRNKELKFGCLTPCGLEAVLFFNNGDADVFPISEISSKPIKSKEDIELEAKEDQVIDMIGLYYDAYYASDIKSFFKLMQENGHLSPVELRGV